MKKKNGFTLVELLVVIALMLSILGIAIVSFVNISNKKKEESWKEVVNQIETAAKDYFSSNEYLFEGLPNNNGKAQISLGKLVNEDYLNVVSDPRSEKRVDKCAIVTVEKKDDKYNVELDEDSVTKPKTDCDLNLTVITSETGRIEDGYGSIAEEICKGENEEKYSYIDEEEKERICKCRDNPNLEECSNNNNNNNDDIYLKRLKKKCYNKNGDEILDPDNTSNGYCYRAKFTLNLENIKGSITSAKYCNSNNEECDLDKYGGKTVKFTNNTNISDEFEGENINFDDFRKALYKCRIDSWQFNSHKYNISGTHIPGMTGYTDILLPEDEDQMMLKKVFIYASFSGTGGRTAMGMGGFFFQEL